MNEQYAQSEQGESKFLKRKVQWRLLLINDHGEILNVPKYEFVALFIVFTLAVSLISSAALYHQSRKNVRKSEKLKAALAHSDELIDELRAEKELLAARLVVAGIDPEEIKRKSQKTETEELLPEKDFTGKKDAGVQSAPQDKIGKNHELVGKAFESYEEKFPIASAKVASLSNFQSGYDERGKKLSLQFKLDNITDEKISGYIIVLLKNPEKNVGTWRALPDSPLENGKPGNYKSGRYFEIRSFKTIRFIAKEILNTDLYIVAEIFIFGKDGSLLVKNEFPLES